MALYVPMHSGMAISACFLCYIQFQNTLPQIQFIHLILKRTVWCTICFVSTGNSAVELGRFDAKIHGRTIYFVCNNLCNASKTHPLHVHRGASHTHTHFMNSDPHENWLLYWQGLLFSSLLSEILVP